jgi:hypothetical protein
MGVTILTAGDIFKPQHQRPSTGRQSGLSIRRADLPKHIGPLGIAGEEHHPGLPL